MKFNQRRILNIMQNVFTLRVKNLGKSQIVAIIFERRTFPLGNDAVLVQKT